VMLWMGLRSWPALALSWGAIALTGVLYLARARRPTVLLGIAVAMLTAFGHGVGTRMFGPFFWTPAVVCSPSPSSRCAASATWPWSLPA
jgi:hypothetical protein